MKKYKCSKCDYSVYTDDGEDPGLCPWHSMYPPMLWVPPEDYDAGDFIGFWGSDLEDANRHDMTDLPGILYRIISEEIHDQEALTNIFRRLYEDKIGV